MLMSIVRTVLPASVRAKLYREWVRARRMMTAARFSSPMILAPTYAEDGLISQHVSGFMTDERFTDAYAEGRAGIPWSGPEEIRFRAYVACWAAQHALTLDGDFVECGVASGVLSRTICAYLGFQKLSKKFFLFDTFKGIPISTLTNPVELAMAIKFNKSHYADDLLPLVRQRFSTFENVHVVPGVLPGSLKDAAPPLIAYLSIDMNNAPAEIGAINYLWNRLVTGAVVLLDDYAYGPEFMNQKEAWDAFARSKGVSILTLPTGQGMIIKPAKSAPKKKGHSRRAAQV